MSRDIKVLKDTKLMKDVFEWISNEFNKGEIERGENIGSDYEPWRPEIIEHFFINNDETMMKTVQNTLRYQFGHKNIVEITHFSECDRYEIRKKS